mgnify:FL=1
MKRKATAVWQGTGMEGNGTLSSDSGVLNNTQYSFSTRFADGIGTNPEELIAAAHAGCFTMALSFQLSNAGFVPEKLETKAVLNMEKLELGWTVTAIELNLEASVPGIDNEKFMELANAAKAGCPVSRLLNTEITMNAKLI